MKATAPAIQVCNADPIEVLLGTALPHPYRNGCVTWIFRYLQFSCKSKQHLSGADPIFCTG